MKIFLNQVEQIKKENKKLEKEIKKTEKEIKKTEKEIKGLSAKKAKSKTKLGANGEK